MRGDFRAFAADENVSRKAVIIVNGIGRLGGDLQRIINGLAREIDGNAADFRTGNFNLIGFDFCRHRQTDCRGRSFQHKRSAFDAWDVIDTAVESDCVGKSASS